MGNGELVSVRQIVARALEEILARASQRNFEYLSSNCHSILRNHGLQITFATLIVRQDKAGGVHSVIPVIWPGS